MKTWYRIIELNMGIAYSGLSLRYAKRLCKRLNMGYASTRYIVEQE